MRAFVIPAKAGTQNQHNQSRFATFLSQVWVPACAGMTGGL